MEIKVLLNGVHHHYEKDGINYIDDITGTVGLIKAEGKNIVVDCGNPAYKEELISALKENALTPKEIDYIIITHLHFDHIANYYLFENAKIIEGKVVNDFKNNFYTIYKDIKDIPLPKGIEIINTPGHVLPHFSVIVEKDNKKIVFSGDAVRKEMLDEDYVPVGEDISKMIDSALKICEVAEEIIPGHGAILKKEEIGKIKNNLLKIKQGEVA